MSPRRIDIRRPLGVAAISALLAACAPDGRAPEAQSDAPPRPDASDALSREPVWHDEFEGEQLDATKWTAERESTYGDGNNEDACLTDRPENLRVADGMLHLTARREPAGYRCGSSDGRFPEGRPYTAAMVTTKGKAAWSEGRIEIRAQLPSGKAAWSEGRIEIRAQLPSGNADGLVPAGWMRPVDGGNGEIDIFELRTGEARNPGTVNQAIHHDYSGDIPHEENPDPATATDGFSVYAVEWDENSIRWFVDGQQTWERTGDTTPWLAETFDREFFLRLNIAVGPDWVGEPTAETSLPAILAVDYVRVYDRSASATGAARGSVRPGQPAATSIALRGDSAPAVAARR